VSAAAAAILALLSAGPAPELEAGAGQAIAEEFERAGHSPPTSDPGLTTAARSLARLALNGSAADAADSLAIAEAVSDSGGIDPVPRAVVVRASPASDALASLTGRKDYAQEPSTHAGIGAATDAERAAVVILLADRKARLEPFPRRISRAGTARSLCGELAAPLARAEVFVTSPDGAAQKVPLTRDEGPKFCATVPFPADGRYAIETVGRGARGPEVAALFFTDVGSTVRRAERSRAPEPTTTESARVALRDRINALRTAYGAQPVASDAALDAVAQAYAEKMQADGFFSHVAPDGSDMRARLRAAGYTYQAAGENLGLANGPLAAHFGIEHSPGHRKNLLEPAFSHLGIGVSLRLVDGRTQAVVVELLTTPAHVSSTPLADAYRAVQDRRQALGLPLLIRSPSLERLAQDHAARALAQDSPKARLPDSELHQRVFQTLDEVASAAVDVFVVDEPQLLTESKSTRDPDNDRLGIGAVKGDSPTYGRAKWWLVVIYASSRGHSGSAAAAPR
jgi:uncharacterized protein YkwD